MPGKPPVPEPFISLEAALATWREWELPITDTPHVLGPIEGGRTNRSFRLRAPGLGDDLLIRLNNPQSPRLGINREQEAVILDTVAAAGLTRGACYWSPRRDFTVFRHIEARTWGTDDFRDARQRRRLMECLGVAQVLAPGTPRRSYTAYLDHYWQQLEDAGAIDMALARRWWRFRDTLVAFDRTDWPAVLTHHDLIPENVLETADRLYLIDWEYAAVGHPDIDRWCLDPALVREPFIHELARWTNELWERIVRLSGGQ